MNAQILIRIHPDFLNFKRPSPHSKFSPSSAERWLIGGCPFSTEFVLAMNIEEKSSKYSEEGTFAHAYCEHLFRQTFYGMAIPARFIEELNFWIMKDFEERKNCIEEMHECAVKYVEVISHWLNNRDLIGDVIHFGLETAVPIIPEEGCFGTADCLIVGTRGAVLIDYKYGKGKNVKPDTVQLKVYGAGLVRYLQGITPDYPIHVVIHQPRTDMEPKEHSYTALELNNFLQTIWQSIQVSKQKDLQPCEGNHCFWCPARRTDDKNKKCPAIMGKPEKLANEAFEKFFADMSAPVPTLDAVNTKRDAAILKLHALFPMIKDIVESTTEEIKMRLQQGEAVQGFYLKEDLGNRVLNAEKEEDRAHLVASRFPQVNPWKDIPATRKLKTLTEIEKEIGKNKLDPICVRKVTKNVAIFDEKMNAVLGDMARYAQMVNNGQGQGE